MKKLILSVATMLTVNSVIAQWTNKNVDNGFDDPYKICYTKENNNAVLKLENVGGEIAFYIAGTYFCSDEVVVDISFMVNGKWQKYVTNATKNDQSNVLFLIDDLSNSEALKDFLNCSIVKLRVNEEYCDTQYFQFNMSASTSAYKFIK